jgi:hypothetical protein
MSHLDHFLLGLAIGGIFLVAALAYVVGRRIHSGHVVRVQRNMSGQKLIGLWIGNRQSVLTPRAAVAVANALQAEAERLAPRAARARPSAKVRGILVEGALRASGERVIVPPYTGKTPPPRMPS